MHKHSSNKFPLQSGPSTRSTQSKLPKPKLNAQKDQERRDRLQEHIDNLKKQQEAAKQRRKNSRSQSPEIQDFISGETPVDCEKSSSADETN